MMGLCLLSAGAVRAETFAERAAALNAKGFTGKAAAVTALAQLGDARAIPLLEAMRVGSLYLRKSDQSLVIVEKAGSGYKLVDAVTESALGMAGRSEVKKIRVNNRVRRAIKAALSRLELLSPRRDRRLAAAPAAIRYSSA